jgi:hypothetical protein
MFLCEPREEMIPGGGRWHAAGEGPERHPEAINIVAKTTVSSSLSILE